jgi:hypothetical protein
LDDQSPNTTSSVLSYMMKTNEIQFYIPKVTTRGILVGSGNMYQYDLALLFQIRECFFSATPAPSSTPSFTTAGKTGTQAAGTFLSELGFSLVLNPGYNMSQPGTKLHTQV